MGMQQVQGNTLRKSRMVKMTSRSPIQVGLLPERGLSGLPSLVISCRVVEGKRRRDSSSRIVSQRRENVRSGESKKGRRLLKP